MIAAALIVVAILALAAGIALGYRRGFAAGQRDAVHRLLLCKSTEMWDAAHTLAIDLKQEPERSIFARRAAAVAPLVLCALFFAGCTQSERVATAAAHTRTQTREIPAADGGKLVMQESWTETDEQATTKAGFDPAITTALSTGAQMIGKAATGDWSGAVTLGIGAVATAAAAYAANQRGQATSANQRADEHKADADAGWAKFEAAAAKPAQPITIQG